MSSTSQPHVLRPHVLKVPWDSGHRCERMARGPGYLLSNGVLKGFPVTAIEPLLPFTAEVQTAFDLARQIASLVHELKETGSQAVVLSGNCNSAVGTIAGLEPSQTGVLWFDAHGEFNTPETTRSAFFDGMPLAVATGRCWKKLTSSIPYFAPLPGENVVMVGVRDTEPDEREAMEQSGISFPNGIAAIRIALEKIAARTLHWYIHFDLDALDPSEATSNQWVPPGGLKAAEIEEAVNLAKSLHPIAGCCVASLDPAYDTDGRALAIAGRILNQCVTS